MTDSDKQNMKGSPRKNPSQFKQALLKLQGCLDDCTFTESASKIQKNSTSPQNKVSERTCDQVSSGMEETLGSKEMAESELTTNECYIKSVDSLITDTTVTSEKACDQDSPGINETSDSKQVGYSELTTDECIKSEDNLISTDVNMKCETEPDVLDEDTFDIKTLLKDILHKIEGIEGLVTTFQGTRNSKQFKHLEVGLLMCKIDLDEINFDAEESLKPERKLLMSMITRILSALYYQVDCNLRFSTNSY